MCIDLDGGVAGDGGGNARAKRNKCFILRWFSRIGGGLIDDFGQRSLEFGSLQPNGRGFDRKCLRAKGFHFKTVDFEFRCDAGEDHHLIRL